MTTLESRVDDWSTLSTSPLAGIELGRSSFFRTACLYEGISPEVIPTACPWRIDEIEPSHRDLKTAYAKLKAEHYFLRKQIQEQPVLGFNRQEKRGFK